MATSNNLPWDPTLVDPTDRPADGLIARFVGGRSGPLSLENGAAISFPWKRQQETAGTFPGTVAVYDNPTTEFMQATGPTLVPGAQRALMYLAGWDDGTASAGLSNGPVALLVASGSVTVTGGPLNVDDITIGGDTILTGELDVGGLIDGTGGIEVTDGVVTLISSASNPVTITSGAGQDATITGGDDVIIAAGDDVFVNAGGAAGVVQLVAAGTGNALLAAQTTGVGQVQGGSASLVSLTTTATVQAATDVVLNAVAGDVIIGAASGEYIHLNNGNQRSVTVNSYPVAPLRDRDGALWGTPPAITAATTGYKWQAGVKTVAFTAGSGLLNFLSAFGVGLVSITVTAHTNDTVITLDPTTGVNDAAIWLRAYTAGAAVTGNVTVSYIALGWS